jgi:hypothetical protein
MRCCLTFLLSLSAGLNVPVDNQSTLGQQSTTNALSSTTAALAMTPDTMKMMEKLLMISMRNDVYEYVDNDELTLGVCQSQWMTVIARFTCLQEALLEELLKHYTTECWDLYGPVWALACDADPKRRPALLRLFESTCLPASSPLHCVLSELPLLDLTCGPKDITLNFDERHVAKRLRRAITSQAAAGGIKIGSITLQL